MADALGQLRELAREGSTMIIILKAGAGEADVEDVCRRIEDMGLRAHVSRGEQRTIIGAIGDDRFKARVQALEALECVESLVPILQPFKLASREVHPADTVVRVDGVEIGGGRLAVMAGPCSVEIAGAAADGRRGRQGGGGPVLRGGAFKPRTSPYAFPGAGGGGAPPPRPRRAAPPACPS